MQEKTPMRRHDGPRRALCLGALMLSVFLSVNRADAQGTPAKTSPYGPSSAGLITIRLEKQNGDRADKVAPTTVFKTGDILRFRLTSSTAGYLYVVDKGSTGSTATLFPGTGAQHGNNHIDANHGYLIPADGEGWFEVTGPLGFDVLYFLVSATPITLPSASAPEPAPQATPAPAPKARPAAPADLLPRCNDEIFKSRGECLDDSAGATPLPRDAVLPRELALIAGAASRDIILEDEGGETTVRPAPKAKLPLIYAFRLAHR